MLWADWICCGRATKAAPKAGSEGPKAGSEGPKAGSEGPKPGARDPKPGASGPKPGARAQIWERCPKTGASAKSQERHEIRPSKADLTSKINQLHQKV